MRKHLLVNPVGLLEIGQQHSRPDTPASIGSDTLGAVLDQSVLSGDDGQRINTEAPLPESSTITTASASAIDPESSTTSIGSPVPLPLRAALQPSVCQVQVFFLLRKGRESKQKWKKHSEMRMLLLINF